MMKKLPWILLTFLTAGVAMAGPFTVTNAPPTVSLAWDPEPGMSFNVYTGVASGVYTNKTSAGVTNSLTITLPGRGATYYFAATAVDTNGLESAYSDEVSFTPKLPPAPPNLHAPVVLIVETKPDASADLWAAAGMNWSFSPELANALFRVRLVLAPQP